MLQRESDMPQLSNLPLNPHQKAAERRALLKLLFWATLTAAVIFLPFTLKNGGIFTLVADFNEQQTSFNMLANTAIKRGDIFWNWQVDLGGSFIGMFAFYNLGSPFFWLTLPFPAAFFPYLMPYLLMLKYVVAALCAYLYLRRFIKDSGIASIVAMAYAFSGFQVINLMFNHFHDVVAFFPLLLLALEKAVTEGRRGLLLIMVAFSAVLNYFFFVGEFVFLIIYFICRFVSVDLRSALRALPRCLFEGILGGMLSAFMLLPAAIWTLTNPRLDYMFNFRSAFTFGFDIYINLLKAIFFPADMMAGEITSYFSGYTSMSAYLPFLGCLPLIIFFFHKKKAWFWLKMLLAVLLIFAAVPIFNAFFYAMNPAYYARWFYMLNLMFCLAAGMVLTSAEKISFQLKINAAIFNLLVIVAMLTHYLFAHNYSTQFGQITRAEPFLVYALITLVSALLSGVVLLYPLRAGKFYTMRELRRRPDLLLGNPVSARFKRCLAVGMTLAIIVTHVWHISMTQNFSLRTLPREAHHSTVTAGLDLIEFSNKYSHELNGYRVKSFDDRSNNTLVAYLPSVSSFISTVNGSIPRFYKFIGSSRFVISRNDDYWTQKLLGVKYTVSTQKLPFKPIWQAKHAYGSTYVYQQNEALPIAVAHDSYIGPDTFMTLENKQKPRLLLRALVSPQNFHELIKQSGDAVHPNAARPTSGQAESPAPDYITGRLRHLTPQEVYRFNTKQAHLDLAERKKMAGYDFTFSTHGLKFRLDAPQNRATACLLSVPWDKGWRATVNGQKFVPQNMGGLMVLPLARGANEIELSYKVIGLKEGLIISSLGLVITLLYIGISIRGFARLKKQTKP